MIHSDIPFKHEIDLDYAINKTDSVPLFVIRMMYTMIKKGQGNLYNKYLAAFKFTINKYVKEHLILITNGEIEITKDGFEKEYQAKTKLDDSKLKKGQENSFVVLRKFEVMMRQLKDEKDQQQNV